MTFREKFAGYLFNQLEVMGWTGAGDVRLGGGHNIQKYDIEQIQLENGVWMWNVVFS